MIIGFFGHLDLVLFPFSHIKDQFMAFGAMLCKYNYE